MSVSCSPPDTDVLDEVTEGLQPSLVDRLSDVCGPPFSIETPVARGKKFQFRQFKKLHRLAMADRLKSLDQKRTELTPGTVLVREWDRQSHRVMVLAEGFAWQGETYDSLSKVAFAITSTRWNGPRFFGLRDKQAPQTSEARR